MALLRKMRWINFLALASLQTQWSVSLKHSQTVQAALKWLCLQKKETVTVLIMLVNAPWI